MTPGRGVVQNGRRRARNSGDELSFEERADRIRRAQAANPVITTVIKSTPEPRSIR